MSVSVTLICVFFLEAILLFAMAYSRLYAKNPRNFLFDRDILSAQKESVCLRIQKDLGKVRANLSYLNELVEALQSKQIKVLRESAPGQAFLSSGRRYEFSSSVNPPPSIPDTFIAVHEPGEKRKVIGHVFGAYGTTVEEESFLTIAENAKQDEDRLRASLEKRLASIPTDTPQVWGPLDFLYFSASIQTTSGMGDMLPNSTRARFLAILQVLVGYALLVVALGIVLSSHH